MTRRLSIFFEAAASFRSPPAFRIVVSAAISMLRPELFIVCTPERSRSTCFLFFSTSLCRVSFRSVASGPPRTLPSRPTIVTPSASLVDSFIGDFFRGGGTELLARFVVGIVEDDRAADVDRRIGAGGDSDREREGEPPDHFAAEEERSEERHVGKECRSRWSPDH